MSKQDDKQEIEHLEQVNAELTASLDRCRELLTDCRSKLTANSNDAAEAGPDQDTASASD